MRIIKSLEFSDDFSFQDIKEQPIGVNQLEALKRLSGSYEALFSRRAKLYKEMGLKEMNLDEKDYKYYLLDHYTFLKRPVIVNDDEIFIGSDKKTVETAKKSVGSL